MEQLLTGMGHKCTLPRGGGTALMVTTPMPWMVEGRVGVQTPIGWETYDIQATYEDLSAKGVEFPQEPAQQFWGGFEATFKDSAGKWIGFASIILDAQSREGLFLDGT